MLRSAVDLPAAGVLGLLDRDSPLGDGDEDRPGDHEHEGAGEEDHLREPD